MPLALLALFVGYLLVNAGIRNEHPWAEIVQAFGGAPPGPPGISPGQADSITPPGQGSKFDPSNVGPKATTEGTPAIDRIVGFATHIPGLGSHVHVGEICGGGSVPGSQHPKCNGVDLTTDTHRQLVVLFHTTLAAAKVKAIPASEVIGPGGTGNGLIATAARGWTLRPYTGPRSHQGHVHVSGDPLL